jgi:hypothetical protein
VRTSSAAQPAPDPAVTPHAANVTQPVAAGHWLSGSTLVAKRAAGDCSSVAGCHAICYAATEQASTSHTPSTAQLAIARSVVAAPPTTGRAVAALSSSIGHTAILPR